MSGCRYFHLSFLIGSSSRSNWPAWYLISSFLCKKKVDGTRSCCMLRKLNCPRVCVRFFGGGLSHSPLIMHNTGSYTQVVVSRKETLGEFIPKGCIWNNSEGHWRRYSADGIFFENTVIQFLQWAVDIVNQVTKWRRKIKLFMIYYTIFVVREGRRETGPLVRLIKWPWAADPRCIIVQHI